MAYLALVRHGQSEYNLKGLWTGFTNVELTQTGREEARHAGKLLKEKGVQFSVGYTSSLIRAQQTIDEMCKTLNISIPIHKSDALNEKNYGDYTGKNKWEVKELVGEKEFLKIRRSWDYVLPNGESLKNVYERAVPYFKQTILPHLVEGENVIVASHGNTLRALIKYLDNISDKDIPGFELKTGEVHLYNFDKNGKVKNKEVLHEANKSHKEISAKFNH